MSHSKKKNLGTGIRPLALLPALFLASLASANETMPAVPVKERIRFGLNIGRVMGVYETSTRQYPVALAGGHTEVGLSIVTNCRPMMEITQPENSVDVTLSKEKPIAHWEREIHSGGRYERSTIHVEIRRTSPKSLEMQFDLLDESGQTIASAQLDHPSMAVEQNYPLLPYVVLAPTISQYFPVSGGGNVNSRSSECACMGPLPLVTFGSPRREE